MSLSLFVFAGSQHELTCNDTRHVPFPCSGEGKVEASHGREPCVPHIDVYSRALRICKTGIPRGRPWTLASPTPPFLPFLHPPSSRGPRPQVARVPASLDSPIDLRRCHAPPWVKNGQHEIIARRGARHQRSHPSVEILIFEPKHRGQPCRRFKETPLALLFPSDINKARVQHPKDQARSIKD